MENPKHGIENLNFVVYCVKKVSRRCFPRGCCFQSGMADRHFGQAMKLGLFSLGDTGMHQAWKARE